MEVQPPWASELLARNRKVARNICWSTSLDSSSGINDSGRDVVFFAAATRTHSYDASNRSSKGKGTMVKRGIATYSLARDGGKVVDPVGVSSSSTYNRTENSAAILEEVAAVAASDLDMKGTSGEESILEYGPGIVRKLRSRYQSLALRQSLGRPTLRRSASLENCLDSASSEPLSSESPSPVPYYEDEIDGDHPGKRSSHPWNRSETNTVLIYNNVTTVVANSNGLVGNRGRSGYNDYSRKDRMRRARSVDALHRPKRHIEEKEILEKLTVVLPKEEIVIIEVSKPQSNISNEINNFNIGIDDKPHLYPRSLHIHTASSVTTTTNGYSGNSSELNRVRSVTSPEHELPPPDIVRETARIFEKNHDPPNNSTSPVNNLLISNVKKVGHALRLSKSSSLSPNSSPLPSPTTASHTNSPTTTITSMMNGQGGNSYLTQNKGHLSDQGLTTSATILNHNQKVKTQESNQRNSASTNGATYNSKSAPSSTYSNQHSKQIGVIRPTVTTTATGTGVISSSATTTSAVKGIKINSDKASIKNISISPEVSPIPPSNSAPLNSPQTKKPPLGPKPLFTSSPKPTTLLANNKTGSANLTDIPVPNGTNAKSPTEEPVKNIFQSENRMKSPTESFSSGKGIISGNMSNKQNIPVMGKASIEIPKEKENDVMEFQQITLKHVAKQKDRAEVILTNGTSNNNSSSNISKTVDSTKTDKRKDENSNANLNNKNTKGSFHQKSSTATTNPSSTTAAITSVSPIQKVKDVKQDEGRPKPDQQQSLLRAHQKQKSDKQKSSGGETMVFNFTGRKSVPDYIEDDGLHKVKLTLGGTVTDESHDDDEMNTCEQVDSRLITFEGANVIINGRSSIQKKPKSQKLNISFNEEAPTTFEYPSEASVLGEDEPDNKDNLLGHKTPNITNGSGLGSYTPSQLGNSYQLGNYSDRVVVTKKPLEKKQDNSSELIEDYLKPDTGSTTWSSEIGAADILF